MTSNCEFELFSIKDAKADVFSLPFCRQNAGIAMRFIQQVVSQEPRHEWAQFSEDFSLYRVGTFDQVLGVVDGCDPVLICRLNSLVGSE